MSWGILCEREETAKRKPSMLCGIEIKRKVESSKGVTALAVGRTADMDWCAEGN